MNKQFFTNNTSKAIFSLLAFSTISLLSAPAQADDALIQETVQESVITGNDNLSIQNSSQQNRQSSVYRDRYKYGQEDNTGIVQRSEQFCDQYGEFNTCVQNAKQGNVSHSRRTYSRRNHYRY